MLFIQSVFLLAAALEVSTLISFFLPIFCQYVKDKALYYKIFMNINVTTSSAETDS